MGTLRPTLSLTDPSRLHRSSAWPNQAVIKTELTSCYPDLITMLFTTYSCAHLCVLWLYCNVWQWHGVGTTSGAASDEAGQGRLKEKKKVT